MGKNTPLIAIIVILLIVIVAGVAYYTSTINKLEEAAVKEIEIDKNIVEYEFENSFITNVKGSNNYVKLTIKLEVDTKLVPLIENRHAEISDRINLILRSKTLKELEGVEGQTRIKEEIREAIKEILQTEKTVEVYVEELIVQ